MTHKWALKKKNYKKFCSFSRILIIYSHASHLVNKLISVSECKTVKFLSKCEF